MLGGPVSDTGCTGRKVAVDTYGGLAHHGGGALSGKDATKVDRSASYMARYIARHVVAAKLATECEVSLAYAIGGTAPLAYELTTFGTGTVPDDTILKAVRKVFNCAPGAIIQGLKLRTVKYLPLAAYGHFGRPELKLPWERLDKIKELLHTILTNR